MAMNNFVIKIRTKSGDSVVKSLTSNSTISDLKACLETLTGINRHFLYVLSGFPPRQVNLHRNALRLEDAGISSGSTLIIEEKHELDCQAADNVSQVEESQLHIDGDGRENETPFAAEEYFQEVHEPDSSDQVRRVEDQSHMDNVHSERKLNLPRVNIPAFVEDVPDFVQPEDYPGYLLKDDVPANNSCLFSSINLVLFGEYSSAKNRELREIISQRIRSDPEVFNEGILGKPNAKYAEWILNENTWGGAIEIQILSEFYAVEIVVAEVQSATLIRFGENQNYDRRVFVIYNGQHYDPMVLKVLESGLIIQTCFPLTDEVAYNMAKRNVIEAKKSFKPLNLNLKVQCSTCHMYLGGHEATISHALLTSHNQFVEVQ